jgi:hypothetical protein
VLAPTMRTLVRIVLVISVLLILSLALWSLTYPSSGDPKNIKYVLWKAGLYSLDPDVALPTMAGDPGRDVLVLGRSKAQLRNEFDALISPSDASVYLLSCYENSSWKEKDVMFLGPSSWMVVFDHDKVTELVLIKGC